MKYTGSLTQQSVSTEQVHTGVVVLDNELIDKVTDQINDNTSKNAIVRVSALLPLIKQFREIMNRLDPEGSFLQDLTVISQYLNEPYFVNSNEWILDNWAISNELLTTTGNNKTNSATLSNQNIFKEKGVYYFILDVAELPSGSIAFKKNDKTLDLIHHTGFWSHEVNIEDIVDDRISFSSVNLNKSESIVIRSCKIFFVADRFYEYLLYKIRELATVDVEDYIDRDEFTTELTNFSEQFQAATSQYLKQLQEHINANNPHQITTEMIGAAEKIHAHEQYVTKSQVSSIIAGDMVNYALKDHTHSEYTTPDDVKGIVDQGITDRINEMTTTDRMVVAKSPFGKLPSRYAPTDISTPTTILLPSTIAHSPDSSFDLNYGITTTNSESLMFEAPKVFSIMYDSSIESKDWAHIKNNEVYPCHFRMTYHTTRKVKGYRIFTRNAMLKEWEIYSGNTTFVHQVADHEFTEEDGLYSTEILFDNILEIDSLSILLHQVDILNDAEEWLFKVEVLYCDFNLNSFGITEKEFQFSVPINGTNRLVTKPQSQEPTVVTPPIVAPNLPYYVFAICNFEDSVVHYNFSYIPPEYSPVAKGIDVLGNKYNEIEPTYVGGYEYYIHPAFGKLSIIQGISQDDKKLSLIYNDTVESWYSDGADDTVIIEQKFNSDNIVLRSYLLSWRKEDLEYIPDTWTLIAEGIDEFGQEVTVVLDAVKEYYPFYSVEDDDIVYHAQIDTPMTVKTLRLTIQSESISDKHVMALNKVQFFINEYYYSIPRNTMYYGLQPEATICLGSANYIDNKVGWSTTNTCYGKSCVIPINNLQKTKGFTDYVIPNPFFSVDIVTSMNNYVLQDSDTEETYPSAFIRNISTEYITIYSEQPYVYAVSISRSW